MIPALTQITEIKRTLTGVTQRFPCRVVARTADRLVALYVSDRRYDVADLVLPAGTVTFATYWSDRPYNVYHWLTPAGETLAYYFNLSAETELGDDELRWLDLTLDVLVRRGVPARVLDEDELPAELPTTLRASIDEALARVRADADGVAAELEEQATACFRGVFARDRAA